MPRLTISIFIFLLSINVLSEEDNYLHPAPSYLDTTFINGTNVTAGILYNISAYLFVTPDDYGRMVIIPSFSPPSSIAVYAKYDDKIAEKYNGPWNVPESKWEYYLTYTVSKEKFGYLPLNKDQVSIQRYDLKISYDLALAIKTAWGEMIENHFKRFGEYATLDGVSYDFSVGNIGEGSTKSPRNGLALEMVNLGKELIEITKNQKPLSIHEQTVIIYKFKEFRIKCRPKL